MSPSSPRTHALLVVAAGVTVVTAALPTASFSSLAPVRLPYLALMATYLGLMLHSTWPRETSPSRSATNRYLLLQLALLTGADYLGRSSGLTWIAAMPLLGQIVYHEGSLFTAREVLLRVAGVYLFLNGLKAWRYSGNEYLVWSGSILGCFIFVYAFSRLSVLADLARTRSDQLASELKEANERLHSQAAALDQLSREQERTRVARELHDSLGHGLTTLAVQLEVLAALPDRNSDKGTQALERARVFAQNALTDVRHSVGALRQTAPLRPLLERLRNLLAVEQASGLEVDLQLSGPPRELPVDVEQACYRTVQEALTNLRRHSGTPRACLALDFTASDRLLLTFSDRGPGVSPPQPGSGVGLQGLRERWAALGGVCQAGPRPEGGFLLSVSCPT